MTKQIPMKKKLLIFGDSYAEEKNLKFINNPTIDKRYHSLVSYHELLRQSNFFDDVISYGIGGSDLWSQYCLFNEKYSGKEHVLFFLTQPGRITVDDDKNYPNYLSCCKLLHQHVNDPLLLNKFDNDLEISRLNAAIEYFKYLSRENFDNFVQDSIIQCILKKCPDVIFVECFKNSFGNKISDKCLVNVFEKENISFGIKNNKRYFDIVKTFCDIRRNHMTEENHKILGQQILKMLQFGTSINYDLFVGSKLSEFNKYFIKRHY